MYMNMKIEQIYRNYIEETKGNDEASRKVQQTIDKLLGKKKKELGWKEFERYRDQIYEISAAAEKAGFIQGFSQAVILMAECFERNQNVTAELSQS